MGLLGFEELVGLKGFCRAFGDVRALEGFWSLRVGGLGCSYRFAWCASSWYSLVEMARGLGLHR